MDTFAKGFSFPYLDLKIPFYIRTYGNFCTKTLNLLMNGNQMKSARRSGDWGGIFSPLHGVLYTTLTVTFLKFELILIGFRYNFKRYTKLLVFMAK